KLNIFEREVIDFKEEPQSLRSILPELNSKAKELGLAECSPEQLETMDDCFDQICSIAKLNSDLRLVRSTISEKALVNFRSSFEEAFIKRNRVRKLFSTDFEPLIQDEQVLKWGVNVLIQREFFIEDPD